ncbi:protein of unknown function DUF190 [Desulfovibrio sp. X2]|uniref:DUF190 domain-containing protein n=1 Tax=Desulfovibrio sp. X2 TaxID=941449 RepID=UPI0003587969|nr:DUF190 domain-containing protein [Desulfovibrio sp. X2]EPR44111.1 protein of unknown function DUF190 [Desulfovibrio sp. X2]
MILPSNAKRLRIYTGEMDRHGSQALSDLIVEEAARRHLAGATVLRGMSGYGANSRVKSDKILVLSQDLPMVIEIVDTEEKIKPFLEWLDGVVREGLVTVENVEVFAYRHKDGEKH